MQTSNGIDYFRLEEDFSDEERAVRDTVREIVSRRFLPLVREHHAAGTFPVELVPEMVQRAVCARSGQACPSL